MNLLTLRDGTVRIEQIQSFAFTQKNTRAQSAHLPSSRLLDHA